MMHLSLVLLCIIVNAHVLMKYPPARGYKGNPSYQPIDYDLTAPLASLVHQEVMLL